MSLLTADRDLEMAMQVVQVSPHLYEGIGFHCQQAVEKYLKAVLISFALPAPFTHNLVLLMGPLQQNNIVQFSAQELADAAVLNEFLLSCATKLTMRLASLRPTYWQWLLAFKSSCAPWLKLS